MDDSYVTREWPKATTAALRREPFGFWQKLEPFLTERMEFFGAFLRRPARVGAILPSSSALAREMVWNCNLREADTVVELGPGTGAITRMIVEAIGKETLFFALELDRRNFHGLRRRFPHVKVYHDSAENMPKYLGQHDRLKADCVISALPWGNMRPKLQSQILGAIFDSLRPGGIFAAMGYWHACRYPTTRHFRRQLEKHFKQITTSRIVWLNVPPAVVYHCR